MIPPSLSPNEAKRVGYSGVVFHSNQYGRRYGEILAAVPPARPKADTATSSSSEEQDDENDFILVAGCGKSAKE